MDKIAQLHRGNTSEVYHVVDSVSGQSVIWKVPVSGHPAEQRLLNEYEVCSKFSFAGVRRPVERGVFQQAESFAYAHIFGQPLHEVVPGEGMSPDRFFSLALKIVAILEKVHEEISGHYYLNWSNVLFNSESQTVHIIDFSLAGSPFLVAQEISELFTDDLVFFAPECFRSRLPKIDKRADLYSLGVLFYYLLTGNLPYSFTDPSSLINDILTKPAEFTKSDIPVQLQNLILKLLSVDVKNRYQNCFSLWHDLSNLKKMQDDNVIDEEYVLGAFDEIGEIQISQRLYGKRPLLQEMLSNFDQTRSLGVPVFVLHGKTGVGKGKLVTEFANYLDDLQIYFTEARCESFGHNHQNPLVKCLSDLGQLVMARSAGELVIWETLINELYRDLGPPLFKILPTFRISDKWDEVDQGGSELGDIQLEGVINKVLQTISDASIPMVISLKSFQNISTSAKNVIFNLIRTGQVKDLSFVISIDDDQITGEDPDSFFSQLESVNTHLYHITINEWTRDDVYDYVSDSLNSREISDISSLIYDKTLGHPFFVNRLLDNIKENQLAVYNQRTSEWQVDWAALNEVPVGQHLIDFQLNSIEKYDSTHEELLTYLSCIGLQFDRATITQLTYLTGPSLGAMLDKLERDYIIVSTSEKTYKWNSEIIKNQIYSKIDDTEKSEIHLKVALYLDQKSENSILDDLVLRKAYHFERVNAAHRTGYEKKIKETFLLAADTAEEMASFELAFKYYKHLIGLLDDTDWQVDYTQTKMQFEKATKMAMVSNEISYGDAWMSEILLHSKDVLDAIYAYELKLNYLTEKHDFVAAVNLLLEVLKKLGHKIKRDPSQVAIMSELARTLWTLKNKKIKDLVNLPLMTDPSAYAFLKLTVKGATSIFGTAPDILPIVFFRQVRFSVVHGNCEYSPFAYISFGFAISVFMDQLKKGYEFGKMALELTDKLKADEVKNRVLVTFYGFLSYWQDDLSLSLKPLRTAYQLGLQKGDFLYSSFALSFESTIRLVCGHNLEHLLEAKNDSIQEVRNLNQDLLEIIMEIERQFVLNLTREKEDVLAFDLEGFDEAAIIDSLEKLGDTASTFDLYAWRLFLANTFGLFDKAYDFVGAAESFSEETTSRQITYPTFLVMSCMAGYEKLALGVSKSESNKIRKALRKKEKTVALFAKNAPQNFECMHVFIQGCRAAHEGRNKESESFILNGITLAAKGRFIHLEAIYRDQLSRLYYQWGNNELAEWMYTKAMESYQKWGATAKVAQMLSQKQQTSAVHLFSGTQSPPAIQDIHDFNTILSANKSLADTGSLKALLDVMIDIIRKNNSATSAIILLKLPHQDKILPVAHFGDGEKNIFDGTEPLNIDSPARITRFVWRTKKLVNAYDITTHKHFRTDSYIVQKKPKAVLCLPVLVKGRAEGVIYMDNDTEAGIFDTKKIEFFDTIVSQFQVSYDNLMVHGRLEELVKERTRKLESVNKQMQSAKEESDRLLLNILPQETADELRRFGQTTAKRFDHVSVLFCDIVDFTKLSENLSPEDLVADLDLYFKAFDEMSMRNGLEKIKTVGDAYLSAGGIPENNTATAVDVINTALEMQTFVKELEAKRREESRSFYQIRIGVHSGPVVAGVVGLRKFQFDIWGDTVNIAARMQQSSEPGKINISQVTYELVKDHFKCTSRGAMIAKNKGQMEMYYVDSKVIKL